MGEPSEPTPAVRATRVYKPFDFVRKIRTRNRAAVALPGTRDRKRTRRADFRISGTLSDARDVPNTSYGRSLARFFLFVNDCSVSIGRRYARAVSRIRTNTITVGCRPQRRVCARPSRYGYVTRDGAVSNLTIFIGEILARDTRKR